MSEPRIGRILKDFAPGAGNPRNSEGAFLKRKDGTLLFVFSRFVGTSDRDHATANIAAVRSSDGGETWSEPEDLFTSAGHEAVNIMSVSLMRMQNGDVGLFYLVRKTFSDMRMILRRSADEGRTWSDFTVCMPRQGYFVVNNDRAVRLSTGRIVLPAAEHVVTRAPDGGLWYSRALSTFFLSDDDGRTWRESCEMVTLSGIASPIGLQEPGVVELKNGILQGWARTDLGRQYQFSSRDGGDTWSPAVPSRFWSPVSPLSVKRLPDGRLFAVWNPIPLYETREEVGNWGRSPLVYAFSADEGRSWTPARVIEDDPFCGYCYTAIYVEDDHVLLAYCAGDARTDGQCLNRLRIVHIDQGEMVTK